MKICILAAGAAGMYCGSCLRDNALASALKRAGHDVSMLPLYTPVRTDTTNESASSQVFFGGVNVYLQHASAFFRKTPRVIDWLLDRQWLLKFASRRGVESQPSEHGDFTLSILRGDEGPAVKELRRLLSYLHDDVKPEVLSLPNLMFIGLARALKQALNVPIICELTGEDLFLDALASSDRAEAQRLIRRRVRDVDRFVATSESYADSMATYLDLPRKCIAVVYPGLAKEFFDTLPAKVTERPASRPPTIGYLARVCPEKGFGRLIEGFTELRKLPGMGDARLRAAGYFNPRDKAWYEQLTNSLSAAGLSAAVDYVGEVDQAGKHALLSEVDVLTVPSIYPEAKGMYLLEALAHGVPVVQPSHGSFPELVRETGGGLLVPPGNATALAAAMHQLLTDAALRRQMGEAGRAVVLAKFTDDEMARRMLEIYRECIMNRSAVATAHSTEIDTAASLVVHDLRKEYPTPTEPLVVLRDVSFRLAPGDSLAIVGPSGSGKSTLLNILGTLDRPTEGTVALGDVDPFSLSEAALAKFRGERVGFIFQDHHLLPQCTALENVLVAKLATGPVTDADEARAKELLDRVGVAARASHLPSELSGGERQRVAIARALMNRPLLLLCDEPTGNLDTTNSRVIGELLTGIATETKAILIVVTHSDALAATFARRMRMNDGKLNTLTPEGHL